MAPEAEVGSRSWRWFRAGLSCCFGFLIAQAPRMASEDFDAEFYC